MLLPVAPMTLPTLLSGAENGNLPDALLDEIQPGVWLMRDAAASWRPMVDAARADGVDLVVQFGYRDYATQKSIFLNRYVTEYLAGHETVVWNGQRYWKLAGVPTAAVPGTSNHGWGLAVDIVRGPGAVDWLIEHAHEHGWSAELQSEPWHWRRHAGNHIAQPEDDEMTDADMRKLAGYIAEALDQRQRSVHSYRDGSQYQTNAQTLEEWQFAEQQQAALALQGQPLK